MNQTLDPHKLNLDYPCKWTYKVIGPHPEKLREAILEVLQKRASTIIPSHTSRTGKYHSLTVDLQVNSEEDRNRIYRGLKDHPEVKMVL